MKNYFLSKNIESIERGKKINQAELLEIHRSIIQQLMSYNLDNVMTSDNLNRAILFDEKIKSFAENDDDTSLLPEEFDSNRRNNKEFETEKLKQELFQQYKIKYKSWQQEYTLLLKKLREQVKQYDDIEIIQKE